MMEHSKQSNSILLYFRTRMAYCERELEELLSTLERRGGRCRLQGCGHFELAIPDGENWIPFHDTIIGCESVEMREREPNSALFKSSQIEVSGTG